MKLGIVFEGGGMRGVYTAGVIEAFLEQQFYTNYVIGVSAGASNGVSYVSKQRGRALRCIIEYANNPALRQPQKLDNHRLLFRNGFFVWRPSPFARTL